MKSRSYLSAIEDIAILHGSSNSFDDFITKCLRIVLDAGNFATNGAVFTVDDDDRELLRLRGPSLLPTSLQVQCSEVRFGHCLCGKAALFEKMIYKPCIDEDHDVMLENMHAHGHIVVPIRNEGSVLGVLNIYIDHDSPKNQEDILFLEAVASLLGSYFKKDVEHRKLQKAMVQRNMFFNFLNRANLVTETDLAGNITFANANFCDVSLYSAAEVVGKNHSIVSSGFHPSEFWEDLWDRINRGGIWKGEICNRAKNGDIYWVHTTIFPKFDNDRILVGFISVRKDITDTKEKEMKLQEEKEANFKQAKLASIGLLAAGIGHEINNPLSIAIGSLKRITDNYHAQIEENETLKKLIYEMKDAHIRIRDIVKEIKIFSREERHSSMEFLDIGSLVQRTVNSYRAYLSGDGISYIFDFPDHEIFAHCLKNKFEQVVLNLLNNSVDALKSLPKGHKKEVRVSVVEADLRVFIYFTDNAGGISDTSAEQIFEYFYTTKPPKEGTGMGLPISRELCIQMGGNLTLERNTPGSTTFKIELLKKNS